MVFKLSIIASALLAISLNGMDALPTEDAPVVTTQTAQESLTPMPDVSAEEKATARKVESAMAKQAKDKSVQDAEIAAALKNAQEVKAADKNATLPLKEWDIANRTTGAATEGNRTEDVHYKKVINKDEYKHILPIAVEDSDHDHDGVPTSIDKCPTTPFGRKVDADGCCIDGDDDHDGVPNSKDKCPTTPEGRKVNADGCEPDTDEDGVLDMDDKCPDTPKLFKVDVVGCPQTAILKVNFDTNKYNIKDHYTEDIKKFSQFLKDNAGYNAIVSGHTDAIGSDESNMVLSNNRANAVRKAIIAEGIDAARLTSIGEGENRPIADNLLDSGRAENRRIEVELKSTIAQ